MTASFDYCVINVDVSDVQAGSNKIAVQAEAVIKEYARKGWRLHTYAMVPYGRVPGFLGIPTENVLHLVFERASASKAIQALQAAAGSKGNSYPLTSESTREDKGRSTEVTRSPLVRTSDDPLY